MASSGTSFRVDMVVFWPCGGGCRDCTLEGYKNGGEEPQMITQRRFVEQSGSKDPAIRQDMPDNKVRKKKKDQLPLPSNYSRKRGREEVRERTRTRKDEVDRMAKFGLSDRFRHYRMVIGAGYC